MKTMWILTGIGAVTGKSLWNDTVREHISHFLNSRLWTGFTVANNTRVFDIVVILNRLINMKVLPELQVLNGEKIMCLKVENDTLFDILNYFPCPHKIARDVWSDDREIMESSPF
jgi:hypothetical protein